MIEFLERLGWCVVHTQEGGTIPGWVRECRLGEEPWLRLDIPGPDTADEAGPWAASVLYRLDDVSYLTLTTLAAIQARARAAATRRAGRLRPYPGPACHPVGEPEPDGDEDDGADGDELDDEDCDLPRF